MAGTEKLFYADRFIWFEKEKCLISANKKRKKMLIDGVSVLYKIVKDLISVNYIKTLQTSTPIFSK